jgi:integrase
VKKKPKWPYSKETILTAAPNGQWCKKHKGKVFYFGVWDDPKTALARWRAEWAGIVESQSRPVRQTPTECTLHVAINNYVNARLAQQVQGDIEQATYREINDISRRVLNTIGGQRLLSSIGPNDFDALLKAVGHQSAISRQKFVMQTRALFRWIFDHLGISVSMGANFNAPPRKAIREQLNQRDAKIFEPDQIHRLLSVASPQMKAIMLLGINGGYGNRDVSELPANAVNLKGAVIDHYRAKTGARRIVPLWDETVEAIRAVIVPGQERLFLDRFGKPIERQGVYGICRMMDELRQATNIACTFYWFRYTFATVASEVPDDHARHLVMGHVIDGVSENYVKAFPRQRLLNLTDHVYKWLYNRIRGSV